MVVAAGDNDAGGDQFYAVQVGAWAALTGLLFVGTPLNISQILAVPALLPRAMGSLALRVTMLELSSLELISG